MTFQVDIIDEMKQMKKKKCIHPLELKVAKVPSKTLKLIQGTDLMNIYQLIKLLNQLSN